MRTGLALALAMVVTGIWCAAFSGAEDKLPPATKAAEVYTAWPFDAVEAAKRQEDTAKALGVTKEKIVDLGDGVSIKFILIPAGQYKMGDAPGRDVTVERPFYMGKFLVTQAQYVKVMGKNPSAHVADTNPADSVAWPDASEFAKKASEVTKKTIRLPGEAQWEWACRAGTATRCYWGNDMTVMGDYCWWHDNCDMVTHPVGLKKPNAFGLYDMMGNVWEWCSDGGGPEAKDHPCRGATFGSREPMFKSTIRLSGGGPKANDRYGFRVAMDVE